MASRAVLQQIEGRAVKAEKILSVLREQIADLKKASVVQAVKADKEKLRVENSRLLDEVKQLKTNLVQLEVRNGVQQVHIPDRSVRSTTDEEVKVEPQPTPVIPKTEPAPAAANKNQAKKPQKDKKDGKPAAKGQGKQPEVPAKIDVSRLDMRIGYIVSAKYHPDADILYVEEVDVGEEKNRTVVSGLVKHVSLEQMQNRFAIFMCNLKPAKMRGILSEGMIMCGSTPEKVEIINPPEGVEKGERIVVDEYPGTPDALLNPKKKIWEQIQPDLKINESGEATYKGALWRIAGKGTCKTPTMRNSPIK